MKRFYDSSIDFFEENKEHLVCWLSLDSLNQGRGISLSNLSPSFWAWVIVDVELIIVPIFMP